MCHIYKRLCRKGACLSGVCAKRHADLITMPTYTARRTHVHRTPYARTPNAVRAYTVRRTCPSQQGAATKRTERADGKHLENPTSGHDGTTSHPGSSSVRITMRRAAGRPDRRAKIKQQMLTGGFVPFSLSFQQPPIIYKLVQQ